MIMYLPSGATEIGPVEPRTWVEQSPTEVGTPVTGTDLEHSVTAAVMFARLRPLFQGLCLTGPSIPNTTWTALPINGEMIDLGDSHSDDANPSRVYGPPTYFGDDWYLVTGYVPFNASSGARNHVAGIRLDGGTIYEGMKIPGGTGHATDALVVDLLHVSQFDYIELMAYQDTGAALTIATGNKRASLTMRWACSGVATPAAYPGLPRTWTAADEITADLAGPGQVPLNRHIRDVARWLRYPPCARLHTAATVQTIPSGAWTSITFNDEHIDTAGGHSTTTNPSRYTAQAPGLYYFYGLAALGSGATGYRAARLLKNGTTPIGGMSSLPATTSTAGTALAAQAHVRMAQGDYIELQAFQTQGSALAVKNGAGDSSRMIVLWKSL